MWKIIKEDSDDLGFAIKCLFSQSIDLNEFKLWIEQVIRDMPIEDTPFYIFDYNPKYELEIRDFVKNSLLINLENNTRLKAVEIDLFELLLESMKNDNILESAFELEEKKGTKFLYEKLKKSFNTEIIMKYIAEKTKDKNFLILTGVGKVFPIVRTHTILNNLQNIFDHTKVLLFFPGEYTSTDLRLFGFQDNNYYRAFKI